MSYSKNVLKIKKNSLKSPPNDLQIINAMKGVYDPLGYPLILPKGQNGFDLEGKIAARLSTAKPATTDQFYKFHLMERNGSFNHLLRCRELFQQYICDQFAKIDTERLGWHRREQDRLRHHVGSRWQAGLELQSP